MSLTYGRNRVFGEPRFVDGFVVDHLDALYGRPAVAGESGSYYRVGASALQKGGSYLCDRYRSAQGRVYFLVENAGVFELRGGLRDPRTSRFRGKLARIGVYDYRVEVFGRG